MYQLTVNMEDRWESTVMDDGDLVLTQADLFYNVSQPNVFTAHPSTSNV